MSVWTKDLIVWELGQMLWNMLWNKLDNVHMLYFKSSNLSIARVEEMRRDKFEVKVDGGIEAWEKIPVLAVFDTLEEAKAYAEITARLEA